MNIRIPHIWLLEHLETKAKPQDIYKYLSLCGPSVERLVKTKDDWIYDIEVTTNRVDIMSVRGVAREASAILPRFGISAQLKPMKLKKPSVVKNVGFKLKINPKLTYRAIGVLIEDIKNWESPNWMKRRLLEVGIRSINAPVDITNYVMTEIGHPTHVFDYDLIKTNTFVIRESKRGEKVISFDRKEHILPGGDIVIDNGKGEIIDLPGIIGTKNSVVNKNTKRILFFSESNDPTRIRKTSMTLGIRTVAATLNEKGVDSNLAEDAILRGVALFENICKAKVASRIYDMYPSRLSEGKVKVSHEFINKRLGVEISKNKITQILSSLEFLCRWNANNLMVKVPTFRTKDILIEEDIVEEIARIYGYFKLPSKLMEGSLPEHLLQSPFELEQKIKNKLKELGCIEIYTLSLVGNKSSGSLELKNPLGSDTKYLRTSLRQSLISAAEENTSKQQMFHLFEMANIYIARKADLPQEKMMLGGIFWGYDYREAKGILETFLDSLNAEYSFEMADTGGFDVNQSLIIRSGEVIGKFGKLQNEKFIYYEIDIEALRKVYKEFSKYIPIPKFPPQIEDITFVFPERTKLGNVEKVILHSNKLIDRCELRDTHKNGSTFRIWYQHPNKTLENKEVEKVRNEIISHISKKFGGVVKN